jgi:hypothetical protein
MLQGRLHGLGQEVQRRGGGVIELIELIKHRYLLADVFRLPP